VKPVPYTTPALSLNPTSISTIVLTTAKELDTMAPKSPTKALSSSIIVPSTMLVTTRSERVIKRRVSGQWRISGQ
jgi:hypothetical protein